MKTKILSIHDRNRLLDAAKDVAIKAYAPYSNMLFGAALLTEKGNLFVGCNVENASYGLTICAERSAIFSAVANEGGENMRVKALAIVNTQNKPSSPCGSCRQVISEFGPNAIIIFNGKNGLIEKSIKELLPHKFIID